METIEERAKAYADNYVVGDFAMIVALLHKVAEESYLKGATEQKAIDIDKAKKAFNAACGWLAVYPWYDGVFEEFVKALEE